jgi:hypothetical protein
MKTIKMKTLAAGIVALVFLLSGCTKEGPVGPTGSTGTQGPSGPSAKSIDFILSFNGGSQEQTYAWSNLLDPLDIVLVYVGTNQFSTSAYDFLSPLPFTGYAMGQNISMSFQATNSTLFITNNPPANIPATLYSFRAVIIPTSHKNIKPTLPQDLSYANIKAIYNLK